MPKKSDMGRNQGWPACLGSLESGKEKLAFSGSLLVVLLASVAGALSACIHHPADAGTNATAPGPSAHLPQPTQIIIKLRDPTLDPSQSHLLDEFSRDAGAALVYVRPMSGGAHVLRTENPVDGRELDRIIGGLAKRRGVEYVEPDRRMRHM